MDRSAPKPQRLSWLMITAVLAAFSASLIQPVSAHRPSAMPEKNQALKKILAGPEVKRMPNSGRGMPSIMGPFPDTLNMEWLGQVVNRDLGASRLIWSGATFLSDIWGWSSGEDDYAIVGHNSGIAFVRVTDPAKPVYLGTVPTVNTETQRNFWWDIKTNGAFAYFVSEVPGTGIGVVNMTEIDKMSGPAEDGLIDENHYLRYYPEGYIAAHNISINEETGFAYLTGVTKDTSIDTSFVENGMIILNLKGDPMSPVEVGQILGRDTHDAHVISYKGPDEDHNGKELAFVFNGEDLTVGIYDVTDLKEPIDVSADPFSITISETTYTGASFTHQGWVTEDRHFMVMGDEEDELFGLQDPRNSDLPDTARTYVWNIQDLDEPTIVSTFDSAAASIDHNVFTRVEGGREFVYQANYTAGVRITELIREGTAGPYQIAKLQEVAHMDTEPRMPNHNLNYNINIWVGPWGVYPFFDKGTIIASDGLNGLVLMRLKLPATD